MLSKEKIYDYKERYIEKEGGIYSETRRQQGIDKAYIDDTFLPPVRHPHKVLRLGLGEEIVSAPAEQIITSNPQAFVEAGNKEAALRISKIFNTWIDVLRRQNPNPFKESVKNKLARGENYIKPIHNEAWVTNPVGKNKAGFPIFDRRGLPVLFPILDPMVIYGSPEEDENGSPLRVVVFYKRQPRDIITRYPFWSDPKNTLQGKKDLAEWFEFWDRDTIFFEADGEAVKHEPNIYNCVPFVRRYSGLGRRSPDGELSSLIVSDIRNSRGLIEEICIMRSDIASVMHKSAHKPKTIMSPGELNDKNIRENLGFESYDLNIISNVPPGTTIDDVEIAPPTREAFEHASNIMGELTRRHPYIMAGFPQGGSGRQQDLSYTAGMKRYDTVIENTETEWATAFEKAFKIMKAVPTLLPDGLRKSDLDVDFRCAVILKAKDPIEEDRLITLGDRLRRLPNPAIDLGTFHTQFLGKTENESKEIMAKMLADLVTIYNPDWAQVMGMVAAEEGGMAMWLDKARQKAQSQGLQGAPAKTTQERALGEVQTELGREAGTEGTRGARRPPVRYERGA